MQKNEILTNGLFEWIKNSIFPVSEAFTVSYRTSFLPKSPLTISILDESLAKSGHEKRYYRYLTTEVAQVARSKTWSNQMY